MSVSILSHGRLLIATLPPDVTDEELQGLQQDLATSIGTRGAKGVVIDVSAIDVLDSFAARVLSTMGEVARLRGARAVVVGIQPAVALALVQLGARLDGVETALDLEHGISRLGIAAWDGFGADDQRASGVDHR